MLRRSNILAGLGLPLWLFVALVLTSTGLFLAWGGFFWEAPRGATHLARFAVSYLAVVPLAALALRVCRQLSWTHLFASVGATWAIKMVLTAVLYGFFAPGTGVTLTPRDTVADTAARAPSGYRPASEPFASAELRIRVHLAGRDAGEAIVWLDRPPRGERLTRGEKVSFELSGGRISPGLMLARRGDALRATHADSELHILKLSRGGVAVANTSLPPERDVTLPVPRPGLWELSCDRHGAERAWLVAVDHPYAARADASGRAVLRVPAGALSLHAVAQVDGAAIEAAAELVATTGAPTEVTLDLAAGQRLAALEWMERP